MDDWHDVGRLHAEIRKCAPDAVLLWQYVPHMYGRGGANRRLPGLVPREFRKLISGVCGSQRKG